MSADLAQLLRRIPQSNEPCQPLTDLAADLDPAFVRGYLTFLRTLGAVVDDDDDGWRASSQTAKYLLESLASYVELNMPLIDDWHTRGVKRTGDHPLQNAATLLYALETRRLNALSTPSPSRQEEVAQVLIKRTNPTNGAPELLFQFDANANQYQLIGGRRKDDETILETIKREIAEELADSLQYGSDYQLQVIGKDIEPPVTLSPTFGALTKYHFWMYHMVGITAPLTLDDDDVWVPVADVLAGYVRNPTGDEIPFRSMDIYEVINTLIDGGLMNLADSFGNIRNG